MRQTKVVNVEEVASTGNQKAAAVASTGNWFAQIPRPVVLHRMDTADCLDDRLFWAMILWSWCGPQRSDRVVIKNEDGFIQRDSKDAPRVAQQMDLLNLLGLAPGMKGHVSRSVARLESNGSIRVEEDGVIYPAKEPPRRESTPVASTGNWHVAGLVVDGDDLPDDPDARANTIAWLSELSTGWKSALKTLKTGYRELLRQGDPDRGIIIVFKEKNRRRTAAAEANEPATRPGSSSRTFPSPSAQASAQPAEAEQVRQSLARYGPADLDTARRLIARSRRQFPTATTEEILLMIEHKGRTIGRGIVNAIAYLVDVVPKGFEGYVRQPHTGAQDERSKQIAYLQGCWNELSDYERNEYLEAFPELAYLRPPT